MRSNIQSASNTLLKNRKLKVFLFFLVLTAIIWLLVELSKTYTSEAKFNVKYKNIPENLLLQNKPISIVDIQLKAPGFSLLKYKTLNRDINLSLANLSKNKKGYYILTNNQKAFITKQLSSNVEVIKVQEDTIYIDLGANISKKVPVNVLLDLEFKMGYNLINSYQVKPDSVLIKGPQKYIDSIQEIATEVKAIKEVSENVNTELKLQLPAKQTNVKATVNKVKIISKVDKFTEGKFKIPVAIINQPDNILVKPFPKEIEVYYIAGLANFNKISKENLEIVFDFNQYKNDTLITKLSPIVQHRSEYISTLKIVPEQIEFLIQKKK
ncbi:CdaR family protein [Lutibacter sp. TH_r2]|uniref:CdaR family protein n=1 Tax=Lutibacter sp. TH_r2 TaxID=3082083 RepID=UPI002952B9A8|nr:CdaR family protein [Lutibacter sp. TH_r2]MDV7188116.1 CdaR family protein [Lutibacter sp. TH_r2]